MTVGQPGASRRLTAPPAQPACNCPAGFPLPRSRLMSADLPRRRGFVRTLAVAALLVVAGLAFGGWWFYGRTSTEAGPKLITTIVGRAAYDFTVTEVGSVENAASIELKCEVKSRGGGGGGER